MSAWLVVIVTILYLWTATDLALRGNVPLAITFAGYAVANVGLIWSLLRIAP